MSDGGFRQDLFYRLKGVELHVPALRSRREDILVLANTFLDRWSERANLPRPELTPAAIDAMLAHRWPGNVRELEHSVTGAATMASNSSIRPIDLGLGSSEVASEESLFAPYLGLPLSEARSQLVEALERTLITAALERAAGNVSRKPAAKTPANRFDSLLLLHKSSICLRVSFFASNNAAVCRK